MASSLKQKINHFFNWEHWPSYMFYIPLLPYSFWLAIKSRHLVFFTAANPSIAGGGCGIEQKHQVFELVPKYLKPSSVFVKKGISEEQIKQVIIRNNLKFPLIAKPNIGFRGMLVRKVNSLPELIKYVKMYPIDIILQEFVEAKMEFGLMYYRLPNEKKGVITSLISKEFMFVVGDGKKSITELINANKRLIVFWDIINKNFSKHFLNAIPSYKEKVMLSYLGNHSKGAKFINQNKRVSPELTAMMDKISHQIEGWYYGRLDIKCNSFEELLAGEFTIVDLNGVSGEPTHMYDSETSSYIKAIKILKQHWGIVYQICQQSIIKGNTYSSPLATVKAIIKLRKYSLLLQRLMKIK